MGIPPRPPRESPAALDRLERYNGLGYRRRGRPSPYLWSYSGHYDKGKYVADGRFDPDAESKQCGGAALTAPLRAAAPGPDLDHA